MSDNQGMIHKHVWFALATALVALIPYFADAQSGSVSTDWSDALVNWKTVCVEKECRMRTDVLRGVSGDPEHPPDPSDTREYVGIDVALLRNTQKPDYFAFFVDPRARRDQGVFIEFSRTTREGEHWKANLDPGGPWRLAITDCDDKACTARVELGLVKGNEENQTADLLEKFLNSNHLLVLYVRDGKAYRTMMVLSPFKREYEKAKTELAKPATGQ
jgi:hypothetical protein